MESGISFLVRIKNRLTSILIGALVTFLFFEILLHTVGFFARSAYQNEQRVQNSQYTIMNVGNSFTLGLGAPPGQSYPDHLNRLLQKRESKSYRVINKGIANANSTFILERLGGWLKEDKPDLVFLMVGEPNQWNKYGYWDFINKTKKNASEESLEKKFEKFRWSSVFRLVELLKNKYDNHQALSNVKYSLIFKHTPLDELHRSMLGYQWIAGIQDGAYASIFNLSKEEVEEGITALTYVFEKDYNLMAALYLSEIYMIKKNDVKKSFYYLGQSIGLTKKFNYRHWLLLTKLSPQYSIANPKLYNDYLKIITSRIKPAEFKTIIEKIEKFQQLPKDQIPEELLYLLSEYDPANSSIPRYYQMYYNLDNQERVFNVIENNFSVNPLSLNAELLIFAKQIADEKPYLKSRYKQLIEEVNRKARVFDFRKIIEDQKSQEDWVIYDLEKMIAQIQAMGAKVIVQTYPPYRYGNLRNVDAFLRRWWEKRQDKSSVTFMDVGKMLETKFSQKNGGEKYYSSDYGPRDDHQNGLGYKEIALLMEPLIP